MLQTGHPYSLESGFNSDKKPSRRSLMLGADTRWWSSSLCPTRFSTSWADPAQDPRLSAVGGHLGRRRSECSAITCTCPIALTSLYLATGQDTACVAENAIGFSEAAVATEVDGLTFRVTLPSLTVGTVGGGTRLPAQRRNLELLGCDEGLHAARKLAEIIAASAAALELSLMAAVVSGTFAQAHRKYGRKNAPADPVPGSQRRSRVRKSQKQARSVSIQRP